METSKETSSNLIRKYQRYLKLEKGYSPNTLDAYIRDVDKLLKFLSDEEKTPQEAKLEDIENFAAAVCDLGIGARSLARILSGVRQFYRFLVLDGYMEADPTELLESPKQPQHLPEVLSTAEVDMLERAIDLSKWEGHRNRAIIEVLFSCGLRVSELTHLKLSNLYREEQFVRVMGKGSKERLVQELRNRLPDDALPWMDASVVLTAKKTEYPPILGTGGNDGRLDFSTNVHQRLKDVLPALGAEPERSRAWMQDLLWGRSTEKLLAASVGQGDPVGAGTPGSSAFGSADAMVNPWGFILMVEGAMLFAASVAKRLGEQNSRVAIPFTVSSSPDGPIPGSAKEEGRGELWAPLLESVTLTELRQVFEEARVSWDGGTASSAVSMYAAVRSFGVNRGISAFQRFGFLKRNGLAFVAVPLDHVTVKARPEGVMARAPRRPEEPVDSDVIRRV